MHWVLKAFFCCSSEAACFVVYVFICRFYKKITLGAGGAAVWVAVGLSEVKVLRGGLFAGVVFAKPWLTVLRMMGHR